MVKYIKGDLFSTDAVLVAHGCNCRGGFASGVAGQVASKYPFAKAAYLEKFRKDGWKLGEVQTVTIDDRRVIANCATQDEFGHPGDGKAYVDYEAVRKVMLSLSSLCEKHGWNLAMPKIGAGLAGGDWNKIESIINEVFEDVPVKIFHLE